MKKNEIITIKNTVFKTEKDLFKKGFRVIKEEGFSSFGKKFSNFLRAGFKRFFREYLLLKFLSIISSDGKIIKNIQGSKMYLDLKDYGIARELAVYGVHEKNSTEELKKILKPGMKVLEIGANIGYYALLEAKIVGEKGWVYAFEPSPYNFNLLKENIKLNGYKNIEIYQKAVGGKGGKMKFFLSPYSNLSGFIKRNGKEKAIEVEVIKLDEFLKEKKIDFLRMDIEGYEIEVLKGAKKTLSSVNKPKYIFIEIHSELLHKKNSSGEEIVRYLEKLGYSVIKSFYRGHSEISVNSTPQLLRHPYLEKGYWETFLNQKKR